MRIKPIYINLKTDKSKAISDQMIVSGSNFITILFMGYFLPIEALGVFSKLMIYVYFLNAILLAYIIQPMQANKFEHKEIAFSFGVLVITILSISIPFFIKEIPILIVAFFSFFYLLQEFSRRYIIQFKNIHTALKMDILSASMQLIGFIFCIVFQHNNLINWIIIITITSAISFCIYILKEVSIKCTIKDLYNAHFNAIQFSKWLLFLACIQWFSGNYILLEAEKKLGNNFLGTFRIFQTIFGLLNILFISIENYIPPRINIENEYSKLVSEIRKQYYSFKTIFIGLSTFLLFISILYVYAFNTPKNTQTNMYFIIIGLFISQGIIFIGNYYRILFRFTQHTKIIFIGTCLSVLLSIILSKIYTQDTSQVLTSILITQIAPVLLFIFYKKTISK